MKKYEKKPGSTPQARDIPGTPRTVWEQINKYGTYNIQPTQDRDWDFPAIEQHDAPKADHSDPQHRA